MLRSVSLLLFLGISVTAVGRYQAVAASGKLLCRGSPASNVKVKLYDSDMFDMDDLLSRTVTNLAGDFLIDGYTDEYSDIEPKINIYHFCNVHNLLNCSRKVTIVIPGNYISAGKHALRMFEIGLNGVYDLYEDNYHGSFDCLN